MAGNVIEELVISLAFRKVDTRNLDAAEKTAKEKAKATEQAYKDASKAVEKAQEAVRTASDKTAKKIAQDALHAARAQAKAAKEAAQEASNAYKKMSAAAKQSADIQKKNAEEIRDKWRTGLKAGAVALGAAVVAGTHAVVEQATAIRDWTARLGDGADELQRIAGAAKIFGVDSEIAFKAIQKLRVGIGEGTAAEPLKALGLDANVLAGMGAEDQLRAIANGLQLVGTDAERTAIAVKLFGEEGGRLIPVLSGGAAGFDDVTRRAQEAGSVMSGEALAAALAFDEQINTTTLSLKGFAASIGEDVLPAATDYISNLGTIAGALKDVATETEDSSDATGENADSWGDWAARVVPIIGVFALLSANLANIADEVRNVDGAISGAISSVQAQVQGQVAAAQRDQNIANQLIGQSQVAAADVHVQESVRLGKQASKIVKGRRGRGGGGRKKKELEFSADEIQAAEDHGDELTRLANQFGAGQGAVDEAVRSIAAARKRGASEAVARKAGLSTLGGLVDQDLTSVSKTDPLLSEIFGVEGIPGVPLSEITQNRTPQVLTATITNNFTISMDFDIDGGNRPDLVPDGVVSAMRDLGRELEQASRYVSVPFDR